MIVVYNLYVIQGTRRETHCVKMVGNICVVYAKHVRCNRWIHIVIQISHTLFQFILAKHVLNKYRIRHMWFFQFSIRECHKSFHLWIRATQWNLLVRSNKSKHVHGLPMLGKPIHMLMRCLHVQHYKQVFMCVLTSWTFILSFFTHKETIVVMFLKWSHDKNNNTGVVGSILVSQKLYTVEQTKVAVTFLRMQKCCHNKCVRCVYNHSKKGKTCNNVIW